MIRRPFAVLATALSLAACGGGGGGSPMNPTPVETFTVRAIVFYDENNNGALDITEGARVPDVALEIRGNTGRSAKVSGDVSVPNVPRGTHGVGVTPGSLPPFYAAPA